MPCDFTTHNDEELVRLVSLGNHQAFAVLVKRHVSNCYKTAFRFLRSKENAQDIVQDCFLKLWKSPQKFQAEKNIKFTTWFSTIIKNSALDFLKKHRPDSLNEDFDQEEDAKNPLELVEERFDQEKLKKAMQNLNENQRQAINLSFVENQKNSESAKIMGLSLKAFGSLLMRSKESLKINFNKN